MFVPHGDIVEMSSARLSSHLGQFRNAVPVSAGGRKGLEGPVVESGLGPGLLVNSPLSSVFLDEHTNSSRYGPLVGPPCFEPARVPQGSAHCHTVWWHMQGPSMFRKWPP